MSAPAIEPKPISYTLELHHPPEHQRVDQFFSQQPFIPMQVGDFVNPLSLDDSNARSGETFRVVAIEHMLFDIGSHYSQLLAVHTEIYPDTAETRRGRQT